MSFELLKMKNEYDLLMKIRGEQVSEFLETRRRRKKDSKTEYIRVRCERGTFIDFHKFCLERGLNQEEGIQYLLFAAQKQELAENVHVVWG